MKRATEFSWLALGLLGFSYRFLAVLLEGLQVSMARVALTFCVQGRDGELLSLASLLGPRALFALLRVAPAGLWQWRSGVGGWTGWGTKEIESALLLLGEPQGQAPLQHHPGLLSCLQKSCVSAQERQVRLLPESVPVPQRGEKNANSGRMQVRCLCWPWVQESAGGEGTREKAGGWHEDSSPTEPGGTPPLCLGEMP